MTFTVFNRKTGRGKCQQFCAKKNKISEFYKNELKYKCKILKKKKCEKYFCYILQLNAKRIIIQSRKQQNRKEVSELLLKEIVQEKRYAFFEKAENWQDAIEKSCLPLVRTGCATPEYARRVIECVQEFGPYIVIVPGLAIPHSTKGAPGVRRTAIAFVKFEQPVRFDEADREKDATLFFALAAVDEDEHVKNMRQLFKLLSDEKLLEQLTQVKTEQDLLVLDDALAGSQGG